MLLRFCLAFLLLWATTVSARANDAEDATVFYAAGVQKQGTALYARSVEEHNAELTKAADYFRKALVLNPNYFDALIHLANVEAQMKQWDKSLEHLEKALPITDVSEINKRQTQQAITYVKSQMGVTSDIATPVSPAMPRMLADGPPFMGWTTFVDPKEHSFNLQVPAGWKAEGGLSRISTIDVRPWVRVIAPDASVCAFIGDDALCPGYVPTAILLSTGFYPGRKYMGGLVLQYIPARKFLDKYIALKLKPHMQDMAVVREGFHPDLALSINGPLGTGNNRSDCASIKVTGTVNGIPAVGYYICCTKLSFIAGSGMWWVTYIAGEVSTAQSENAGLAVLTRMIQTSQIDPSWQQKSLAATAQYSANYRANANAISQAITNRYWSQQAANDSFNQAYWNRQAVQDHAADNFSDAMRGQQTVADPTTGTQYKVQQANEHWINPMGQIMGTTGGAPDTDWRQLNDLP